MASQIHKHLTPDERAHFMKVGAYTAFSEAGIRPSKIDGVIKQAFDVDISPSGVLKAVIATSILTGIPVGIAAHAISSKITRARGKEKELLAQTNYYQNASRQLERGLAAADAAT